VITVLNEILGCPLQLAGVNMVNVRQMAVFVMKDGQEMIVTKVMYFRLHVLAKFIGRPLYSFISDKLVQ
jgi:hypothetical protein